MHDPAWQRREAGKNKLRPQAYRGPRKKFTIAPVWSGLDCKSTIACDLLLVLLSGHLLKKGSAVKGAATLSRINQSQGFGCTGRAWSDPKHTQPHFISGRSTSSNSSLGKHRVGVTTHRRARCNSPRNSCEIPLLLHRSNRLACAAKRAFIMQRALRPAPLAASAPQPDLWSRTLP